MTCASKRTFMRSTRTDSEMPLLTRYLRLLVTVMLGTTSVGLAVAQLVPRDHTIPYLTLNQQPLRGRLITIAVCWGVGLLVAIGVALWSRRGPTPQARKRALVHLFAPLVASAFVPIVFVRQVWDGREFAYLAYLLVLGLCLERLLSPALAVIARRAGRFRWVHTVGKWGAGRTAGWIGLGLAAGLGIYYALRVGHLTNVSHYKFQTSSSDLAEYDNLFFNALSGHPFRSPAVAAQVEDWSYLAGHAQPILYFLLPLYAIAPGAPALLWIQASLIGLSAIPIYLLARARLGKVVGLSFATAFLMMPVTQQPNFYDFHFTCAAVFFISWLLYFVYRLKHTPRSRILRLGVYSSLFFALICREDIGIGTAVLGVVLLFWGAVVRDAIVITALSAAYFISMKFAIMPLFGTWWFDNMYGDLKSEGVQGFGSIIVTLLSNQAFILRAIMNEPKALYLLHMTVPVLALWLRRPLLVLAVIPAMISSLLVTNRPPLFQASFQYAHLWMVYTFVGSIVAVRRSRKFSTALALVVVALSLDVQRGVLLGGEKILGGFSMKDLVIRPDDHQRMKEFKTITSQIPKDAVLAVTEREGPHLSNRPVLFSLKFSLGHSPEYLLTSYPGIRGEQVHIRAALESGDYGVIDTVGPYTLVKRGASTKKNGRLLRQVGGRMPRPKPPVRNKKKRTDRPSPP